MRRREAGDNDVVTSRDTVAVADTVVRLARGTDANELARLRWIFTEEDGESELEPLEPFRERFRAFFHAALESGRWTVWVAERDQRLVGTLSLQLVARVPRPNGDDAPIGYITNVYVDAAERNSGIGRRLLDTAMAYAEEHGAETLVLWPSEASIRFYERAGFRKSTALEHKQR